MLVELPESPGAALARMLPVVAAARRRRLAVRAVPWPLVVTLVRWAIKLIYWIWGPKLMGTIGEDHDLFDALMEVNP